MKIATIIVTYNRKDMLRKCILANLSQTYPLSKIIVVDNGSKDGTEEVIKEFGDKIVYLRYEKNLGSAKAFAEGLKYGIENDFEWFWLMDDDCFPKEDALEKLTIFAIKNKNSIFGCLSVDPKTLESAWYKVRKVKNKVLCFEKSLSFNGFLIHKDAVEKIGYPCEDLFIRNDDREYSFRAKFYGINLFLVPNSILFHPMPKKDKEIKLFGRTIVNYKDEDLFKKYISARNFVAVFLAYKKYIGIWFFLESVTRFLANIFFELLVSKNKITKFKNYLKAIKEGMILKNAVAKNIKK